MEHVVYVDVSDRVEHVVNADAVICVSEWSMLFMSMCLGVEHVVNADAVICVSEWSMLFMSMCLTEWSML